MTGRVANAALIGVLVALGTAGPATTGPATATEHPSSSPGNFNPDAQLDPSQVILR